MQIRQHCRLSIWMVKTNIKQKSSPNRETVSDGKIKITILILRQGAFPSANQWKVILHNAADSSQVERGSPGREKWPWSVHPATNPPSQIHKNSVALLCNIYNKHPELWMLSSVALYCQVTAIAMVWGSQLSEISICSQGFAGIYDLTREFWQWLTGDGQRCKKQFE